MLKIFRQCKQRALSFIDKYAHTKYADYVLALAAFSEASFFLVPPDVFLIAILMYGANRWFYYATFTTIFSVLGGLFGYLIGFLFFDVAGEFIISTYNLESAFQYVSGLYNSNAFLTVFISAFTPIPYKIFTITAGLFNINLAIFLLASISGRFTRFFLVSYIMKMFNRHVLNIFMRYFNTITILIVAVFLLFLIF